MACQFCRPIVAAQRGMEPPAVVTVVAVGRCAPILAMTGMRSLACPGLGWGDVLRGNRYIPSGYDCYIAVVFR